jgi:hypothetical protein
MTERDNKLKSELERFNNLLEQTKESAMILLDILFEIPPIAPYPIHAMRVRLNKFLPKDELDVIQKELNNVRELYRQDD